MSIQPEILRKNYRKFSVERRVLLTGHSHQAWPDCAEEGVVEAFRDAAELADDKWGRAFSKAETIRSFIASVTRTRTDRVALAQNTHELFCRFLSALPKNKMHIVVSKGEFHSVRRQILALARRGLKVSWVDTQPITSLAERLVNAVTPDTAAIICSSVLYETATVVPHLDACVLEAHHREVEVFLDGYHSFMAAPIEFSDFTCSTAFLSGGGYKYAQWGEGVCWLTIPSHFESAPTFTGWFSDFEHLDELKAGHIAYGSRPAERFAGSTYDPTSHYRAARVVQFFEQHALTCERLRALSMVQTSFLIERLGSVGLVSPERAEMRGGFVAYRVEDAPSLVQSLRAANIYADCRGSTIRFGPAPYITMEQLEHACGVIAELMRPIP